MMLRLFLVAGEPSGDRLGAALMAGIKALTQGPVSFHGIGGPLMQAEGLQTLFPMEELSVMGLTEILANYRRLSRRVDETAAAVQAMAPDALITIDIPEFSLRVAARVKAALPDLRTIHYVAPTVWAWRPGRAKKMAKSVDHVLALLPFEPPYMEAAGMSCDFVGHPVVAEEQATEGEIAAFRAKYLRGEGPVILVLPGSRRSEVERLMPIFGAALRDVLDRHPDARIVLPAAPAVAGIVAARIKDWPGKPIILEEYGMRRGWMDSREAYFGWVQSLVSSLGFAGSLVWAAAHEPREGYDYGYHGYNDGQGYVFGLSGADTDGAASVVRFNRAVKSRIDAEVPCLDVPPDGQWGCKQQSEWGKCVERGGFMEAGVCDWSCGRCGT